MQFGGYALHSSLRTVLESGKFVVWKKTDQSLPLRASLRPSQSGSAFGGAVIGTAEGVLLSRKSVDRENWCGKSASQSRDVEQRR